MDQLTKHVSDTSKELFHRERDRILKVCMELKPNSSVYFAQHIIEDPSKEHHVSCRFTGVKVTQNGDSQTARDVYHANNRGTKNILVALKISFVKVEVTSENYLYVYAPEGEELTGIFRAKLDSLEIKDGVVIVNV